MENLREDIREVVQDQYEDGWKSVIDIDILTDKILAILNRKLDLKQETLYNRP